MKKHILVIEPDQIISGRICGTLGNHDLDVVVETSGTDGLAAIQRHPPDVIILNPDLYDMESELVYLALKRNPRTRHAPVVILTDSDNVQRVLERFPIGSVDYHIPRSAFVQYILVELLRCWGYIGQSLRLPRQNTAVALCAA